MNRLLQEGEASLSTLGRLLVGREAWDAELRADTGAFLRSFAGAAAGLPFAIYSDAPLRAAMAMPAATSFTAIWAEVAAYLVSLLGFPLLLALLVGRLGGAAGFGRFVVVYNWLQFWLNMAVAALALGLSAGLPAFALPIVGITLTGLSLFLTWRLAREALTGEFALSLAVVVLSIGVEIGSDQLVRTLVSLSGYVTPVR